MRTDSRASGSSRAGRSSQPHGSDTPQKPTSKRNGKGRGGQGTSKPSTEPRAPAPPTHDEHEQTPRLSPPPSSKSHTPPILTADHSPSTSTHHDNPGAEAGLSRTTHSVPSDLPSTSKPDTPITGGLPPSLALHSTQVAVPGPSTLRGNLDPQTTGGTVASPTIDPTIDIDPTPLSRAPSPFLLPNPLSSTAHLPPSLIIHLPSSSLLTVKQSEQPRWSGRGMSGTFLGGDVAPSMELWEAGKEELDKKLRKMWREKARAVEILREAVEGRREALAEGEKKIVENYTRDCEREERKLTIEKEEVLRIWVPGGPHLPDREALNTYLGELDGFLAEYVEIRTDRLLPERMGNDLENPDKSGPLRRAVELVDARIRLKVDKVCWATLGVHHLDLLLPNPLGTIVWNPSLPLEPLLPPHDPGLLAPAPQSPHLSPPTESPSTFASRLPTSPLPDLPSPLSESGSRSATHASPVDTTYADGEEEGGKRKRVEDDEGEEGRRSSKHLRVAEGTGDNKLREG